LVTEPNVRPVIGLCSGFGSGKPRLLEECRLYCDRNLPEVLFTTISLRQPYYFDYLESKERILAIQIVVNLISTFYGHEDSRTFHMLQYFDFPGFFEYHQNNSTIIFEKLLKSTMQHLITHHQDYFNTTFKDFVLCIDDSQIAVNRLFYGCSEEKDLFRYIEDAVLEADIPGVKTHLAISASDPIILRRTAAQQRMVFLINQQGNVSVDFVLDHIWNKPFEKYGLQAAYAKIKKRLAFFAHGTIEILWSVYIYYVLSNKFNFFIK
jgi:hypothetical protein